MPGYPWQNATASLKLFSWYKSFNFYKSYPWQNATASLKLSMFLYETLKYSGYPWQNATASLKLDGAGEVIGRAGGLSVAKRHGLIEALLMCDVFCDYMSSYPWQNATASLKLVRGKRQYIRDWGYPWQNATASLKLAGLP